MEKKYSLSEIAELVSGTVEGDKDIIIKGISSLEDAKESDIVIFYDLKLINELLNSKCSALIIPENIRSNVIVNSKITKSKIIVKNARIALKKVLDLFYGDKEQSPFQGIDKTSVIHPESRIGKNVNIGAYVVIEKNVTIDNDVIIYPFCYIGMNVKIGKKCILYPNVSVYKDTIIGDNVVIHSGTVIGSDGFGYVTLEKEHMKILQVGIVEIGDNVEIGANVAIDRSTLGKTIIGSGTKIDNLVHIAHSVQIGKNCLIAGQVGIAGSVKIGNNVMMGGQVGIADHVNIGNDVNISGQAGVIGDIKSGMTVSGFPARPIKEFLKAQATLYKWLNKKQLQKK
jgi:UDP-3-O-[3-hydroxymyristoyl] glucosamine N-acyltransferase